MEQEGATQNTTEDINNSFLGEPIKDAQSLPLSMRGTNVHLFYLWKTLVHMCHATATTTTTTTNISSVAVVCAACGESECSHTESGLAVFGLITADLCSDKPRSSAQRRPRVTQCLCGERGGKQVSERAGNKAGHAY